MRHAQEKGFQTISRSASQARIGGDRVVGALAVAGGVLILAGTTLGILWVFLLYAPILGVWRVLSGPFLVGLGVTNSVLGCLAIWLGVRPLKGWMGNGTAYFLVGLIALPGGILSYGWVPAVAGSMILLAAGGLARAARFREAGPQSQGEA